MKPLAESKKPIVRAVPGDELNPDRQPCGAGQTGNGGAGHMQKRPDHVEGGMAGHGKPHRRFSSGAGSQKGIPFR